MTGGSRLLRRPSRRLAALALLALACGARNEAPHSAILISIDTLRADHLGCYGHRLETSPQLDAFAAEGVLFEDASATSPWTLPSHASLLTGLWPSHHGVRTRRHRIPFHVPTLAHRLATRGYDTAAWVNAIWISPSFGFQRGFGTFHRVGEDESLLGAASNILGNALEWLDRPRVGPFFLFLHLFDVHSSYGARPEVEALFVERRSEADGTQEHLERLLSHSRAGSAPASEELDLLSGLYDAGLRQLDEDLGGFFDALEARGLWDDTFVVITSDHGEGFGEHGSVLHGADLHRESLHVPLLIRGPGVPQRLRVATPASIVDVAPTLLDLLGLEPDPRLDGRSLRGAWGRSSDPDEARAIFAEGAPAGSDSLASIRVGRHKLVLDESSATRTLYDVEEDPQELHDLADAWPEVAERLLRRLTAHRRARRAGADTEPLTPQALEQLRALGYAVD